MDREEIETLLLSEISIKSIELNQTRYMPARSHPQHSTAQCPSLCIYITSAFQKLVHSSEFRIRIINQTANKINWPAANSYSFNTNQTPILVYLNSLPSKIDQLASNINMWGWRLAGGGLSVVILVFNSSVCLLAFQLANTKCLSVCWSRHCGLSARSGNWLNRVTDWDFIIMLDVSLEQFIETSRAFEVINQIGEEKHAEDFLCHTVFFFPFYFRF